MPNRYSALMRMSQFRGRFWEECSADCFAVLHGVESVRAQTRLVQWTTRRNQTLADNLLPRCRLPARPKSVSERGVQIEREHLASKTQGAFSGGRSPSLCVTVQGEVYGNTGLLRNELGDLAGARAGVIGIRRSSPMAGSLTGSGARTTFVRRFNGAVAGCARASSPGLHGIAPSRPSLTQCHG